MKVRCARVVGVCLTAGLFFAGKKRTRQKLLRTTGETIKTKIWDIRWVPNFFRTLEQVGILNLLWIICFSGLVLHSTAVQAQAPVRDPTPAEKKVIEQYANAIHSFLVSFDSDDWDTKVDFDVDGNVLVGTSNEYPLDIDELIQRSYTVKKDSPLYQREVAPFLAKMDQMSPTEMAQAAKKLKKLNLEVQVHFNRAAADSDARTKPQLQVPGAVYSFMTEESDDKRSQTVVLLFGDWKSAQSRENGLGFRFKHPPHTPVIENVVIQLQGSPDRIRELLHTADWKRVNNALIGAGS